jgi:signal transduction histidine kinase
VLDQRARRVLHDDALPRLHAAMLMLSNTADQNAQTNGLALLADVHRQISNLLREMPASTAPEVGKLGLLGALRQVVEGELAGAFDNVRWEVTPEGTRAASAVPALSAEVIFYAAREAIRNAARHGRNGDLARPLNLRIAVLDHDGLEILIEDDGAGLVPGQRSNGGSGQGLALHSTMMAVVGGSLATESAAGKYTRVTLALPLDHSPHLARR